MKSWTVKYLILMKAQEVVTSRKKTDNKRRNIEKNLNASQRNVLLLNEDISLPGEVISLRRKILTQ